MPLEVTKETLRFRQKSPKQFKRFRVKKLKKGVKAVIGFKNSGSEIQSVIFERKHYGITKARKWLKKKGLKHKQKRKGR